MAKAPRASSGPQALERLGRNLASARRDAGLSQDALADLAGVNQGTISRVEAGKREPGVLAALYMARALGIELADLTEGVR